MKSKSRSKSKPPAVPIVPSEILTPLQVCKLLSISRVTLWRLVKENHIPVIRLSRRLNRFRREDILALSQPARKKAN